MFVFRACAHEHGFTESAPGRACADAMSIEKTAETEPGVCYVDPDDYRRQLDVDDGRGHHCGARYFSVRNPATS